MKAISVLGSCVHRLSTNWKRYVGTGEVDSFIKVLKEAKDRKNIRGIAVFLYDVTHSPVSVWVLCKTVVRSLINVILEWFGPPMFVRIFGGQRSVGNTATASPGLFRTTVASASTAFHDECKNLWEKTRRRILKKKGNWTTLSKVSKLARQVLKEAMKKEKEIQS